jgi:hypothetical protein
MGITTFVSVFINQINGYLPASDSFSVIGIFNSRLQVKQTPPQDEMICAVSPRLL